MRILLLALALSLFASCAWATVFLQFGMPYGGYINEHGIQYAVPDPMGAVYFNDGTGVAQPNYMPFFIPNPL